MSHLLRQSLIFTILATIAIGLLAWSWSLNSDPDAETPTAQKPASPRLSTVKTHAAKEADRINPPQPANIDANARLLALYEKYPELAVEQLAPDLELDKKIQLLFPQDGGDPPTYQIELMLLASQPHDSTSQNELQIRDMLKACEARISQIVEFINSQPDLRFVEDYHVESMHTFLTTGYGYYLENGDLTRAASIYGALSNLTQSTRDLNSSTRRDSLYSIDKIAQHNLEHFTSNPEFISNLPSLSYSLSPNSTILLNSFAYFMESIYRNTSVNSSGNYMTAYELTFDDPFADYSLDQTVESMPIKDAEDIMIKLTLDLLHYYQSLEGNTHSSEQSHDQAPIPTPLSDGEFTSTEVKLAETSGLSGLYFLTDSNSDSELLAKAYSTAFQIACAQYKGLEWSKKLPVNYKTGKPIVWDKENNLLETGIDGDATIPIPVIK